MKVICVDDEQPALDTFRLKAKGFPEIESLRLFSDCEEAIRYAGENRIDAAFLDIEMPDMGGIELARELKKKDCNIRIFFMTAFEQYALDAFGVKALGYIMKPYTKAEIGEALEAAGSGRKKTGAARYAGGQGGNRADDRGSHSLSVAGQVCG